MVTYVCLLDHAHIVGAIADAQSGVAGALHECGHLGLLLRRHPTAHHRRACLTHLCITGMHECNTAESTGNKSLKKRGMTSL